MPKYHISPKTLNPNVCTAKKKCPLGEDTPHFTDKDEAKDYVAEKLKQVDFGFDGIKKASGDPDKLLDDLIFTQSDTGWNSVQGWIYGNLGEKYPDLKISDWIEAPDYIDLTLVENDGQRYLIRSHGGSWDDVSILNAQKVYPASKPQYVVAAARVEDTGVSPRITKMMEELKELEAERVDNDWVRVISEDGSMSVHGDEPVIHERQDGSKLICFPIDAPGDRSFLSEPYPVKVPLDFDENGERQNSREMDRGFVIYDTAENLGVAMKWRSASDGIAQESDYLFEDGKVAPLKREKPSFWSSGPGDLFILSGAGETVETDYYTATEPPSEL